MNTAEPDGVTLDRHRRGPWPVEEFLELALRICTAVGNVHDRGVVHRDIKPANLLLDPATGTVRLTNFERATRLSRERLAPEAPEAIVGTLPYMAPEQTGRMNRSVDSRSDLYSLGVTFYELLTGALPYAAHDPTEWVHAHVARQPIPPTERLPSVPAPLSEVILKLLAKSPEDRYQTAAGLTADLQLLSEQLHSVGRLLPIRVGARDVSDRLLIPEKLYGRDAETQTLREAFERVVATGAPELVLVVGDPGIGKSSLVNDLHRVITQKRGLLAVGKFDQDRRGAPYTSIAQAFAGVIRQILVRSANEVEAWRDAILGQLGDQAAVLVDLIPELGYLLGNQPPVSPATGQEAQNRFQTLFSRFVGVFASQEHPLVLFLDDLQWQDAASAQLFEHLLTHPDTKYLLVVGAFRDAEVTLKHPLTAALKAIQESGTALRELRLGPIGLVDVTQMLSETLRMTPAQVEPLAALINEKTAGNPFFTVQFLSALHEEGLLVFAPERGKWKWDLERIRSKGFADNVVNLMVAQLGRLPAATLEVLKTVACLGGVRDPSLISVVHGKSLKEIDQDLWEALQAGYLVRAGSYYKFVHDRVQEAVYTRIPAIERQQEHLRIARLMLKHGAPDHEGELIFATASQFNRALDLITDPAELEQVRRLHIQAGRKARGAAAYGLAAGYFDLALQGLSDAAWAADYETTFAFVLDHAECELWLGELERADMLLQVAARQARTALDCARVDLLRGRRFRSIGRFDLGLEALLEALRRLGVHPPATPTALTEALAEATRETAALLGGRNVPSLVDAPHATDPWALTVSALLSEAQANAYQMQSPLLPWLARTGVNLALRSGNSADACFSYVVFAILLALSDEPTAALQFSEMSLKLSDRFSLSPHRGVVRLAHVSLIVFRVRPFAEARPYIEEAFATCLASGDFGHASAAATHSTWMLLEEGRSLDVIRESAVRYAAFAKQVKNELIHLSIGNFTTFVDCLKGLTGTETLFTAHDPARQARDRLFEEARFAGAMAQERLLDQIVTVIYGNFAASLASAEIAKAYLPAVAGSAIGITYHFYRALALAGTWDEALGDARKAEILGDLQDQLTLLEANAHHCAANYLDRHLLVLAEQARLRRRDNEAMRLYDQAIDFAEKHGFLLNRSLASERAAAFYLDRGFLRTARAYLQEARNGYARWGAAGKVRKLDLVHSDGAGVGLSPTNGVSLPQLDLHGVIKAAQAVSGEILLGGLIEKLLGIVVDLAGASRGLLLLPKGAGLVAEAEAVTREKAIEVRLLDPGKANEGLPESVLGYVLRTRQDVVVDDATSSPLFSDDPYVHRHQPRSILCFPLLRQTVLSGVLYLENRLAPGVFTPSRIELLRIVAAQATISLENARLYTALEEERARLDAVIDQVPTGLAVAEAVSSGPIKTNRAFDRIVRASLVPTQGQQGGGLGLDVAFHADGRRYQSEEWPLRRAIQSGATINGEEAELQRPDGSRAWVSLSAAPVRNAKGGITAGVITVEDITERRQKEAALRASEERFSKAFHKNPTPMAVIRLRDAVVVDANQNLLETLGIGRGALVDRPIVETTPWLMELVTESRSAANNRTVVREREVVAAASAGQRRDFLISVENVELDQTPCLLMTFVDLTERKRIDEQLRQSQKMEAIGSLAGGVAHDFNNLLTVINGYSDLLLARAQLQEADQEGLRAIRQAGERAANLTRKLLAFSRRQDLQPTQIDVNHTVAEMQVILRRLIETDIEFDTRLSLDVPLITAERAEIEQILMNLVVNARDAMPTGGVLTVATETVVHAKGAAPSADCLLEPPPGRYLRLSVSDTGVGMSDEVKSRIFEPFYTTKGEGKGTGLGLSVVYAIVKRMRGGICVSSQAGQGTTFAIDLPGLWPTITASATPPAGQPLAPPDSQVPHGDERILLAEDEDHVRGLIGASLRDLGYHVVEAANGREAIERLEGETTGFDLVLTDLMMPEVGGHDLARHVRNRHPRTAILFMSASATGGEVLRTMGEDADLLVPKPFELPHLARKIRDVLDKLHARS
ncbi:MAG TPA: AAA family ATPase [Polyangia bacterium]